MEYLPELLAQLRRETGLIFVAVCSGGAALCQPSDARAASFAELLEHVPYDLKVIVAIVCGNDLFDHRWKFDSRKADCYRAAEDLCDGMRCRAEKCFAVVGGSSSTWKYESPGWSALEIAAYDHDVEILRQKFERAGVAAVTGARELAGLEIADSMGHVKPSSWNVVFQSYSSWVAQCRAGSRREWPLPSSAPDVDVVSGPALPTSPAPPPPPPPPPPVSSDA